MKKVNFILTLSMFCLLVIPQAMQAQTEFNASDLQVKITGESTEDYSGQQVAAGDFNNDGVQDILIGSNDAGGANAGATYLFYGSSSVSTSTTLDSANAVFVGENSSDMAGTSSLAAGDFNGDGIDDILIGAMNNDAGGTNAGAVYLIYGSTSSLPAYTNLSGADVKFIGQYSIAQGSGDRAGSSLANAGDINGDGIDDILIGAKFNSDVADSNGAVYIIYGSASLSSSINLSSADVELIGESAGDNAGSSVAGGDVNNDSYNDIIIGAMGVGDGDDGNGAIYIVYGSASLSSSINLSSADVEMGNTEIGYTAGRALDTGDLNGDSYSDIIIAASQDVCVIYGSASLSSSIDLLTDGDLNMERSASGNGIGFSVRLTDFNNDGLEDVVIGDNSSGENGEGEVYVFFNESLTTTLETDDADLKIVGDAQYDALGSSGYPAGGDYNGDGFDDIILGAYGEDSFADDAGATYVGYVYLDSDGDSVAGDLGMVSGTDCDDTDSTISENQTYYADNDEDGYGDPNNSTSVCSNAAPDGYVDNANDDDDNYNSANVPSAPENPSLQDRGIYKATVEWDEVSGAVSYNIRYRQSTEDDYTTVTSDTNSVELTSLINAGKYYWQVQAVSGDYTSEWTTEKRLVTYPRKVKKAEFTFPKNKRQANQVRIKIETMAKRITGFNVLAYKKVDGKWKKQKTVKVANKSNKNYVYKYIDGLKAGTKYKFEVKARRTIGSTKYLSQNVAKRYIATLEE